MVVSKKKRKKMIFFSKFSEKLVKSDLERTR